MRKWIAAWAVAGICTTAAQESPAVPETAPAVDAAIPPAIAALGEPKETPVPDGIRMAVTAADENVQEHVLAGLNHLHGGWETEASRHFAAAMKADPQCLMAHWGMIMSLLAPSPETGPARNAAADRLLDLVDAGHGTPLERGYAYGLIKYMEEGPAAAAVAFAKVAEDFPNDMQAAIFAALFGRGGYDESGNATPDQERAEKRLEALVEKHPDNPVPLNALLTIRAEALDLEDSLPLARKLSGMAPDYPPYFHLLGHYEWRSGEHWRAASAFSRAAKLYGDWMQQNNATPADCPGWVMSECYRVVALASKGDFDTAYAAARQVARTPIDPERAGSAGVRLILWEAKTLPARLLLRRGFPGNTMEALASLPEPEKIKPFHEKSLAYWWIDGLRIALESKRLMEAGELQKAREASDALTHHGENMAKMQRAASALGERASWVRAFHGLEMIASEMRGRLSLAGPKSLHLAARNWFRSAADRQSPATQLYPPTVLTPMAARLGEYHLAMNEPGEAVTAFQEALRSFPNDIDALKGLKQAAERAEKPDIAEEAATQIKALEEQ